MKTATEGKQREEGRRNLLAKINEKISVLAVGLGEFNVYRIFLHMLTVQLTVSGDWTERNGFAGITFSDQKQIIQLFLEVSEEIRRFQASKEEGDDLFCELLRDAACNIAEEYRSAFLKKEHLE